MSENIYKNDGWEIEVGISKECPKCHCKRISQINTYQEVEHVNLSSGRVLESTYTGKRKNLRKSPFCRVFHSYLCRKCGWQSKIFDE